jgi:transposase-like protein
MLAVPNLNGANMKRTVEFWQTHVAAIEQEGISTHAYSKRHGLAVKSLYRWQRTLRVSTAAKSDAGNGNAFVAPRVDEAVAGRRALSACTLMLPSGLHLEMATLPAPEWLAALGRAIQGAH